MTQFVGIDATNSQLVYLNNSDEMDTEEFSVRVSLLTKHPVMNISRLLQDGHLYIFKRWVIDLINEVSIKRSRASLKEHVLPLLVKSQHQRVLADREGVTKGNYCFICSPGLVEKAFAGHCIACDRGLAMRKAKQKGAP